MSAMKMLRRDLSAGHEFYVNSLQQVLNSPGVFSSTGNSSPPALLRSYSLASSSASQTEPVAWLTINCGFSRALSTGWIDLVVWSTHFALVSTFSWIDQKTYTCTHTFHTVMLSLYNSSSLNVGFQSTTLWVRRSTRLVCFVCSPPGVLFFEFSKALFVAFNIWKYVPRVSIFDIFCPTFSHQSHKTNLQGLNSINVSIPRKINNNYNLPHKSFVCVQLNCVLCPTFAHSLIRAFYFVTFSSMSSPR